MLKDLFRNIVLVPFFIMECTFKKYHLYTTETSRNKKVEKYKKCILCIV